MDTNSYFRRPFWRVTAWPYCSTSLLSVIWTIPKHRINDRLCMCGCVVAGNGGDIQQVWAHPLGRLPLLNILTQRTVSNSIISTALTNCLNYVKTEPESIKIKKLNFFTGKQLHTVYMFTVKNKIKHISRTVYLRHICSK